MNTTLLKAESKDLRVAYLLYFVLQAPYAYVGNWGYQILYWMVTYPLYLSIFSIFGLGDIEFDFLEVMGLLVMALLLAIWPVNVFFSLPNMVKKENLRIYNILRNTN